MVRHAMPLNRDMTKAGIVLLVGLVSFLLFLALYPVYGSPISSLLCLPALVVAALDGTRAGVFAWTAITLAYSVLLLMDKSLSVEMLENSGLFGFGMILLGVIVTGKLADRARRAEAEVDRLGRADAALNETRQLDARINQTIAETIFIYNLNNHSLTYLNHALPSLPDYTPEKLKTGGMKFFASIIHPDDIAHFDAFTARFNALPEGQVLETQFRVQSPEGGWRWLGVSESVFARDSAGKPTHLIGTLRDVTDARTAARAQLEQEKLSLTQDKERELYELKSRLMTTISHEFRTPLSVILASGELLERYYERLSPERRAECVAAIKTQITHLREMLDDMQLVILEERSPQKFHPVPLDLSTFCAEVVAEVLASISASHTIPFTSEGAWDSAAADPNLLRPILTHLLLNGIKYSPLGTPIACQLSREGDQAVIVVKDSGLGIPHDEQQRIFDTLYRGSNVSHISGLGLGLKIVRDYVALHQGTVTLNSEMGAGTTFTVRLPIA